MASNIVARSTSFVGRESDLEALRAALTGHARVVTVLGPGGVGKTRLVLELARAELEHFDEVWFCDMSEARSPLDVLGAIAREMDVALETSTSVPQAIDALASAVGTRGAVLLVLDNLEQVVEHAPVAVVPLVERAPSLRLLVTSRERLRVAAETTHDLVSLEEDDAVRLFSERARSVRSDYRADDDRDVVRRICRELDGLPLAIELAAARMRILSAVELAQRLSARFELLTAQQRGAVERHATLRAALDWSWDLLTPAERSTLAQCSVFEGGFTLPAAEAVVVTGESTSIIDLLQALRDKSLLLVQRTTPEMRFGMYTTVREYARERLHEMGVEREAFERHAQHYLRHGLTWAARAEGRRSLDARAWLAAEQDNVLAVHRRALEPPVVVDQALRAALVLQPQLITQGPAALRLEVLDRALASVPPDPDEYIALLAAWSSLARSDGLLHLGRMSEAEEGFPRVLEVARRYGERHLEGRCHWRLGSLSWFRADTKLAREHVERALVVFRQAPDRVHEGRTLSSLGLLQAERGELEEARASFEQALAVHEEAGDRRWLGVTTGRLGELEDHTGRADDARRLYEQALAQHRALRNRRHEAQALIALAALEHELGDKSRARQLYEQALTLHQQIADRRAEALGRAQLGICLFELGHSLEAAQRFDEARSIAQRLSNPRIAALVAAWRIPLELERGELDAARALAESAVANARELEDAPLDKVIDLAAAEIDLASGERERARARLDESRVLAARSAIVRRAARRLEAALACEPPADVLVMATNGAWFRPAGGARVDLQNRRSLRLLLSELTRRRFERAGEPIGIEELFAIGWPGERARREAALSRVYVALSTLRKLGLKGVLIKRDEGYLLDERIPIERWS